MKQKLITITATIVIILHCTILYLWVFDWEKLVTKLGLISWIGAIFIGVMCCIVLKQLNFNGISKKLVAASTIMVFLLASLAVIIEFTTNSMP